MKLLISVANFGNEFTIFRVLDDGASPKLLGGEILSGEKIIYKGDHLFLSMQNTVEETKRLCVVHKIEKKDILVSGGGGMSLAFKEMLVTI